MIGFNGDWDEPDVWSTPTPSPLVAEHTANPNSTSNDFSVLKEPHASSSSPVQTQLDFSNESFQPSNAHNIVDSNSDQEPSIPQVLQSPLQFISPGRSPEHSSDRELPPASDSQFPSLSLVTGSWPTEETLANDDLFDPGSTLDSMSLILPKDSRVRRVMRMMSLETLMMARWRLVMRISEDLRLHHLSPQACQQCLWYRLNCPINLRRALFALP